MNAERAARAGVGLLLLAWGATGAWLVHIAPFRSGTDESIEYVAFAAARNRWANAEDFRRHHIDHYYYAPLYYLCFAPFWSDSPALVDRFPAQGYLNPTFGVAGGRARIAPESLARVPPELDRLYRASKLFSLACGVAALAAIAWAARIALPGPASWRWALVALAPAALLPQFLYYQTLCNNDGLLNGLAAGATLTFVAALDAANRDRLRAFRRLSAATAALFGLALFTKASAVALAPLLAGLVAASALIPAGGGSAARLRAAARTSLLLAAIAIAAGGWWVLYGAWHGDAFGMEAHRIAHPWASLPRPLWELMGWGALLAAVARSYYGMFSGAVYGISDPVFLVYMLVPASALVLGALALAREGGPHAVWRRLAPARRVLLGGLLTTLLVNLLLVILNTRQVNAPYGRLLFPSLAAGHLLLAWALCRAFPRAVNVVLVAVLALHGTLFAAVFPHRLVEAVRQPPESIAPLIALEREPVRPPLPVWILSVSQPVRLPPGRLAAFRVWISRSPLPVLGGRLHGALVFEGRTIALRPLALSDGWAPEGWSQLELEQPVALAEETRGSLSLSASRPFLATRPVLYSLVPHQAASRLGPATINGQETHHSLVVSALYAR